MAKGFKHGAGGGGASLNFKVVGNPQPENPKENTIWVDTDAEITGWDFRADEPFMVEEDVYANGTVKSEHYVYTGTGAELAGYSEWHIVTVDIPERATQIKTKTGSGNIATASHSFYDANGSLISTVLRKADSTLTYTIPSGAKQIRVSFHTSDTASIIMMTPDAPEGRVWFITGTSHTVVGFNALKKNGIMVYPKSAKQYVDGAWVDVTAKIWQNDEWVNWARYIFQSGKGAIVPIEHFQCNKASSSHTNDSIVHTRYNSGSDYSATSTTDIVDLNGYSMLYARAKCTSQLTGDREQCIGLSSKKPSNFTPTESCSVRPDIALTNFVANSATIVYSLPIPSGLEYAFIWIHGNGNAEVYDIWME